MLIENAHAFIERLQHSDRPVFDGHGHAEQRLHGQLELIGYKGKMTWILFDVVQDHVLVRAKDRPGQAVLERNGNLCELSRIRACGGSKEKALVFFVIQQDGCSFTVQ